MISQSELLLTWADLLLGGLLLVSLIVGAVRGLVFEALSLAGWVIAYFAAPFVAPTVATWLPPASVQGAWQELAALILSFVLVLVLVSIAARLLRVLLHATPLKGIDRLLGAFFGLVRGVLLCLLAAVLLGFTPLRKHPAWEQSHARPLLAAMLEVLSPLLPERLHEWVQPKESSSV